MELLAPAGNLENFQAALDAGADAIYAGVPGVNARNLARDFKLEEIAGMVDYCHNHGKKIYLAANSLVLENELPKLLEVLTLLNEIKPDALIVQDLGLIQLVRNHFPNLVLHASTLMTAHNRDCVELLTVLGCERVVLARELTLKEITNICENTSTQLEVFVHGAMCYSYSGLCLFSSYLGGKSGLRGRCVQPCRRKYTLKDQSRKAGKRKQGGGSFLFSMNDLSSFQAIPALRQAGVVSLKIEGRLRSAHYVSHIVKAYRTVMDASEEEFDAAVRKAEHLAKKAMSRRVSSGYFFSPQPQDAIVPHHSGNVGIYLGSLNRLEQREGKLFGYLKIKETLSLGDRLRLHLRSSGDNIAFSLKELHVQGKEGACAQTGASVRICLPVNMKSKVTVNSDLFLVDVAAALQTKRIDLQLNKEKKKLQLLRKSLGPEINHLVRKNWGASSGKKIQNAPSAALKPKPKRRHGRSKDGQQKAGKPSLEFWVKTDNLKSLEYRWSHEPDHFLIPLSKKNITNANQIKKFLGRNSRKVIWSLPPVLLDSELRKAHQNIQMLMRNGFKSFQVGHLSQVNMFGDERVHLYGDFFLNILNSQSVNLLSEVGFAGLQVSIENDRENLGTLIQGVRSLLRTARGDKNKEKSAALAKTRFGLTVYGAPALFTSRLSAEHFNYNKIFVSPKEESFRLIRNDKMVQAVPQRPFSLFPYLEEIKGLGIDYMIIDLLGCGCSIKELEEINNRMIRKGRLGKLPTFNYLGKLV